MKYLLVDWTFYKSIICHSNIHYPKSKPGVTSGINNYNNEIIAGTLHDNQDSCNGL